MIKCLNPLKATISILLTGLLVANTMVFSIIVLDYYANQSFYADTYCVNKNVPDSGCQGKCYLKENLKKTEKKQHGETELPSFKLSMEYLENVSLDYSVDRCFSDKDDTPVLKNGLPVSLSLSVFRPPQA